MHSDAYMSVFRQNSNVGLGQTGRPFKLPKSSVVCSALDSAALHSIISFWISLLETWSLYDVIGETGLFAGGKRHDVCVAVGNFISMYPCFH